MSLILHRSVWLSRSCCVALVLVSEGHLLFPKARAPRTPCFIYAAQDSDGRRVSEWAAEHDHLIRAL